MSAAEMHSMKISRSAIARPISNCSGTNYDDAGHRQSAFQPLVGIFGDSVDVVSDNDATFFGRPIEQRRIVETAHPDLLHDEVIKLRQTQSQTANDAMVKVLVNQDRQHKAKRVSGFDKFSAALAQSLAELGIFRPAFDLVADGVGFSLALV
jgi:hypothetical protein